MDEIAPVVAGLAVGVAFVIAFSVFALGGSMAEPTSNEVISISKGGCAFSACHIHDIFIYGNGTAIHKEYDNSGSGIYYIFQIPRNITIELILQFYEADISSIPKQDVFPTDVQNTVISFTGTDGKTARISYYITPQELRDLEMRIEQLTERYDDRIADCTDYSIKNCPVHEPELDDEPIAETGAFIPEFDVGRPIEVVEANDNDTTILIEYAED